MLSNSLVSEECAICYDDLLLPVQCDCKHEFCGGCVFVWWETLRNIWHVDDIEEKKPKPLDCPRCFKKILFLIPTFEIDRLSSVDIGWANEKEYLADITANIEVYIVFKCGG